MGYILGISLDTKPMAPKVLSVLAKSREIIIMIILIILYKYYTNIYIYIHLNLN